MAATHTRTPFVLSLVVAVLVVAQTVQAGPPLLCHPYDIGDVRSLPWGPGPSWFDERADYDVSRVLADTEELLTPSTPVIVRMETLRRAAIYASRDERVAATLLTTLTNRVHVANSAKGSNAFAYLDAAYVIEAFRQIGSLSRESVFRDRALHVRDLVKGLDGYALIRKSLMAAPGDPALEFAAALIASGTNRAAYQMHAERARAGAARDALLARNLNRLTD